jgi:hypothetical protein
MSPRRNALPECTPGFAAGQELTGVRGLQGGVSIGWPRNSESMRTHPAASPLQHPATQ